MAVDLTAFSRRVAWVSGIVGLGLLGAQAVQAELAILRPGWGGESLNRVTLRGADARQQLIVTQTLGDGSIADQTREAALIAEPAGLVRVTDGLVEPLANGVGVITALTPHQHRQQKEHCKGPIGFRTKACLFWKLIS